MESQSIGPMSAVTFDEAMAKLIGYEGTAVPEELIRGADTQPWTNKSTRALSDLNRELEFCSIEDALLVRLECLQDCLSESDHEPSGKVEDEGDKSLRNAIQTIEESLDSLQLLRETFQQDRLSTPQIIEIAASPSGLRRYRAHSVAIWARRKFDLAIDDWYDISTYNLFDGALPKWIDVETEQKNAHFDVLDSLLRSLLTLDQSDLEGSNRYPNEWPGCFKKNGTVNTSEIIVFIEHQWSRLDPSPHIDFPQKDVFYDRLKSWKQYYLTGLYSCRPIYTDESIANTRLMIAGFLIGIAHDSYGEELCDAADEDWPMPETTIDFIATTTQRISPETTKEILRRSIGHLMQKIRDLDET